MEGGGSTRGRLCLLLAFCLLAIAGSESSQSKCNQVQLGAAFSSVGTAGWRLLRLRGAGDAIGEATGGDGGVAGAAEDGEPPAEFSKNFFEEGVGEDPGADAGAGAGSAGGISNLRLDLLKHLDDRSPAARAGASDRDVVVVLPNMTNTRVVVLFVDGTNVAGTLLGHDRNSNVLLDNCTERVFPPFTSLDTLPEEELLRDPEHPIECDPGDPDLGQHSLAEAAGLGRDDEIELPLPGKMLIRGENIAMVLQVSPRPSPPAKAAPRLRCMVRAALTAAAVAQLNPDPDCDAERNPFPRLFAYASARTHRLRCARPAPSASLVSLRSRAPPRLLPWSPFALGAS